MAKQTEGLQMPLVSPFVGLLVCWLVVDCRLVGRSFDQLIGWSIVWLAGLLFVRSVGPLVG